MERKLRGSAKIGITITVLIASAIFVMNILLASAVTPATRYVATDGTDTGGCTVPANPCKTIQYAISNSHLTIGDTIIVSPGTYEEQVNIDKNNLNIQSTSGALYTIIDVTDTDTANGGIIFNGNGNTFDGFTIIDYTDSSNENKIIRINSNNNTIRNNIIQGNLNQEVSHHTEYGILGYGSGNTIDTNEIYDIGYHGINIVYSPASGNTITNNIIHDIGMRGIAIDRAPSNTITNNQISNLIGGDLSLWGEEDNYNCETWCWGIIVWGANANGTTIDNQNLTNLPNGITLSSAQGVTVQGSEISDMEYTGIKLSDSSWIPNSVDNNVIKDNKIYSNQRGIIVVDNDYSGIGSENKINWNEIYNNEIIDTGLHNYAEQEINAKYNWWGCPEGPNQEGCDSVEGTVDYDPWLTGETGEMEMASDSSVSGNGYPVDTSGIDGLDSMVFDTLPGGTYTLDIVKSSTPPSNAPVFKVGGDYYTFESDLTDGTFQATMTFSFDCSIFGEGELIVVYYYNESSEQWEPISGIADNTPPACSITITTDHFTQFTIGSSMFVEAYQISPTYVKNGVNYMPLLQLNFTNTDVNADTLNTVRVTWNGTSGTVISTFSGVKLWEDDGDGIFSSSSDTQIGSANFNSSGVASFTGLSVNVPAGSEKDVFVTYDISTGNTNNTIDGWIKAGDISLANSGTNLDALDPSGYATLDAEEPTVAVNGAPSNWQNTNATASVDCNDDVGCNASTYMLKTYASATTLCPTDYSQYGLPSPQGISSHVWVCAAAKDYADNVGFSTTASEFKVDEDEPNSILDAVTPDPRAANTVLITGNATDATSNVINVQYQVDTTLGSWTNTRAFGDGYGAGDGSFNSQAEKFWANVTFTDGTHTVYSRAVDQANNIEASYGSDTFCIDTVKPVALIGGPYAGNEGSTINFDASQSYDPLPNCGTITIQWDLDNDGQYDDATGTTAAYTWTDNGVYTIKINVSDAVGNRNTTSTTVTVNNVAPTVNAGSDQNVNEGDIVTINPSFTDPGADTHTAVISWGDGNITNAGAVTSPFSHNHVYADNGAYIVEVNVTDDDGGLGTDTLTVTVNNVAPTVTVTNPNGGEVWAGLRNVTWTIIDNGSADTHTSNVYISNNSGTNWTLVASGVSSPYELNTTTYADNTTYRINVTVTDDDGGVGSDKSDADFEIDNTPPTVAITSPISGEWKKGTITVTHTETDANTCAYQYNNGAWNSSITCNVAFSFDTTLCSDGTNNCTITIMANDTNNLSTTNTTTFSVDNSAPIITYVSVNKTRVMTGDVLGVTTDGRDPQGVKSCWAFFAYTNGTSVTGASNSLGTDCNGTIDVPAVSDGNYMIRVRVRNKADTDAWQNSSNVTVDNTPPYIVSVITGNNSNGNSTTRNKILITFDGEINSTTVEVSDFAVSSSTVTGVSTSDSTVTLTLSTTLATNTTPQVNLTGNGVKDIAGNSNSSASLTASDGLSPTMDSAITVNTTRIDVTFSENLDASTVQTTDFQVTNLTNTVAGVSVSGNKVTLVLGTQIGVNDRPYVHLIGPVSDGSGNAVSSGTVRAEDGIGPAVENVTITLYEGLDFFSVAKQLINSSVSSVLSGVEYVGSVKKYDSVNGWTSSTTIDPLYGYWINVTTATTVTFSYQTDSGGVTPPSRSLKEGWNTIGTTHRESKDGASALSSVDPYYSHIMGFNNQDKTYSTGLNPSSGDMGYDMTEGGGYWIFMTGNGTLASLT